jgi:N-acetylglucosaminyldiphosphoundecaprenol N-acetyl-beta-D-mannosaminyltransferase
MDRPKKIDVFGVKVDDFSFDEAVAGVLKLAEPGKRGNYVVTVNAEFVMLARRDRQFARILADADLALADGKWVAISKLILGGKAQDRVAGVDLVEKVCSQCAKKAVVVGFLGGFGGVAKEAAKRQIEANPRLKVGYAGSGDETIGSNLRLKVPNIGKKRIDVLFVAYGMGRQELWIDAMRKKLDVGVFVGVGGAFDLLAGVKKRAPKVVQNLGLEWLWRLGHEPGRVWRHRVLPAFFVMFLGKLVKSKISKIF